VNRGVGSGPGGAVNRGRGSGGDCRATGAAWASGGLGTYWGRCGTGGPGVGAVPGLTGATARWQEKHTRSRWPSGAPQCSQRRPSLTSTPHGLRMPSAPAGATRWWQPIR